MNEIEGKLTFQIRIDENYTITDIPVNLDDSLKQLEVVSVLSKSSNLNGKTPKKGFKLYIPTKHPLPMENTIMEDREMISKLKLLIPKVVDVNQKLIEKSFYRYSIKRLFRKYNRPYF